MNSEVVRVCGRYASKKDPAQLAFEFDALDVAHQYAAPDLPPMMVALQGPPSVVL